MKCPKCGYLGFETTDRCRNCQYDFSLASPSAEPELPLHSTDRQPEPLADFDLPSMGRSGESLSATALDLDRLFGEPEPPAIPQVPPPVDLPMPVEAEPPAEVDPEAHRPEVPMVIQPAPIAPVPAGASMPPVMVEDASLPFETMSLDEAPLVPPPAARPPLAVRRSTPEVPRNRPRTTRPVRTEPLNLEPPAIAGPGSTAVAAEETIASLIEQPSLRSRLGAGLIDLLLLAAVDAVVLYLTLRVAGLQNTLADLLVLPPVPLLGFLALLGFGYVAAFTVAGGQTIGKMALSLRVIGDDGRPVDVAGAMLRALGCMLVPLTLGLSYLPALFTSGHRALHDRLAGTRVVQE